MSEIVIEEIEQIEEVKERSTLRRNLLEDKRFLFLLFAALFVLSVYLKSRLLPALVGNIDVDITVNPDAAFYLRWFDVVLARFPHMPASIDYFSNYPWGISLNTPPVWPYTLAALSLLASNVISQDSHITATMIAVGIQALVIAPVFLITREAFGKKAALVSAICAAAMPAFVVLAYAAIDHNSADIVLVPSIYAAFLLAIRHIKNRKLIKFSIAIAVGGILISAATLISLSLLLIISFLLVPVFAAFFILPRDDLKPIFLAVTGIFSSAAVFLLMLFVVTPWFSRSLVFERLSVLHISLYATYAVAAILCFFLLRSQIKMKTLKLTIAAFSVIAIGIVFLVPQVGNIAFNGYYRSIGSYPLGLSTIELFPVSIVPKELIFGEFTYLLFLIPVIIAYLGYGYYIKRTIEFAELFVLITAAIFIFYFSNAFGYYVHYIGIYCSIFYGVGVYLGSKLLVEKYLQKNTRISQNQVFLVATAAIAAFMVYSSFGNFPTMPNNINAAELFAYINTSTEKPKAFNNPTEKPSYSVMCFWSDSYRMEYLGRRATISSGNSDVGMKGIITSTRFFQSRSEEAAVGMLKGLNCRYVALFSIPTLYSGDISRLGEPMPDPAKVVSAITNVQASNPEVSNMIWSRMLNDTINPDAYKLRPPLHRFRLVFLSRQNKNMMPGVCYEFVEGAKIVVQAKPKQQVLVSTTYTDPYGNQNRWQVFGITDKNGEFTTIAPYANTQNPTSVMVEPYQVMTDTGNKKQIDVSNDAVVDGKTIKVEL